MAAKADASGLQAELDELLSVRLWGLLAAFEQRLSQELEPLGLTRAGFRLVGELMRSPEGLGQAELARRLGVRPPTVSTAVSRLEDAGVVERHPDPRDARAYLIRLAADAPLREGAAVLERIEADLVAGLDPDARQQLLESLDHLSRSLSS